MPMNVLFMDGDTTAIFKLSETHQIVFVFVFTKQFLIFLKKITLLSRPWLKYRMWLVSVLNPWEPLILPLLILHG